MVNSGVDPARLYSALLNTGLQTKDNPLYQVIYQLIGQLLKLTNDVSASTSGGAGTSVINQTIQQLLLGESEGGDSDISIPGPQGEDGINGMVPYFIALSDVFNIPEFKQALFSMNIDNEGILEVDGFLIEVNGIPESVCCVPPVLFPEDSLEESFVIPGPIGLTGPKGEPGIPGLDGDNLTEEFYAFIGKDPLSITITTTGNIDDLDFGNADLIRMNNASLATIRGLKAGKDGQRVTIVSINAEVDLAHQNANSSASYRLINFATSGITPLAAAVGIATYEYDGTTARWRLIAHDQGDYISPAFSAGDYTGSGAQTVTVAAEDVTTNVYFLSGRRLYVAYVVSGITVGGVPSTDIRIAIPNGYSVGFEFRTSVFRLVDNGTVVQGIGVVEPALQVVRVLRQDIANWSASADNTTIQGELFLAVT